MRRKYEKECTVVSKRVIPRWKLPIGNVKSNKYRNLTNLIV